MSLSPTVPGVMGGVLPNLKDEEDRKKWTEELDFHLPGYKTSKREVGRILKELKDVYCRLGCRGNWSSFLQSKGIALRTAYDLIRRYTEGDADPANKIPRPTHPSVLLQLPQTVAGQAEVKAAIAKLGRAKATEIMFAALLQAAADDGTGSTEGSWEPQADFRREEARNDEEYTSESGGSAEFEPSWEAAADSPGTTQAVEPYRLPQADQQDIAEPYPWEQDRTGQIPQTIAIPESKLDLKPENKHEDKHEGKPQPPPRTSSKQIPTYIPPWWDCGGPPY